MCRYFFDISSFGLFEHLPTIKIKRMTIKVVNGHFHIVYGTDSLNRVIKFIKTLNSFR